MNLPLYFTVEDVKILDHLDLNIRLVRLPPELTAHRMVASFLVTGDELAEIFSKATGT
jgi:hypothetical protein